MLLLRDETRSLEVGLYPSGGELILVVNQLGVCIHRHRVRLLPEMIEGEVVDLDVMPPEVRRMNSMRKTVPGPLPPRLSIRSRSSLAFWVSNMNHWVPTTLGSRDALRGQMNPRRNPLPILAPFTGLMFAFGWVAA